MRALPISRKERIRNVKELYKTTHSISECVKLYSNKRFTVFDVLDALKEDIVINDEVVEEILFDNNRLISSRILHMESMPTEFEKRLLTYLNDRFIDSESIKETLLRIHYKRYERPLCAECHKNKVNFTANKFVFTKFCSRVCSRRNEESQEHYRQSLIEKYGDEHYNNIEKNKQTCIEKYGKDNVFATDWCKQKIEKHWEDNFGVKNPQQVQSIRDKTEETNISKYGCKTFLHSEHGDSIIKARMNELYGVDYTTQNDVLITKVIKSRKINSYDNSIKFDKYVEPLFTSEYYSEHYKDELEFRCKICGNKFKSVVDTSNHYVDGKIKSIARCPNCFPYTIGYSRMEEELYNIVKGMTNNSTLWGEKENRRVLEGLELDIYLPVENVALEFNGVYWHSTHFKDKYYHLLKTELCEEQGIKLIHIFEDEWYYNKNDIISKIRDVINNSVSFSSETGTIRVERSFYNRCAIPECYEIINEEEPEIISRRYGSEYYDVYNCGILNIKSV